MDKETVYIFIKNQFASVFDLDSDSISPEKLLDDDLGLDSLDMIDLVIALNDEDGLLTGQIEPTLFKHAKTVQDVIDIISPYYSTK